MNAEASGNPGGFFAPGRSAVLTDTMNWANLDESTSRFAYYENGEKKSQFGIDVSEHQGQIDWNQVKSDGVDFVYVRLGYRDASDGSLQLDENYWTNIEGAQAAGIDTSVYFYSQATSEEEAREEAQFVLDNLPFVKPNYPIVYDQEPSNNGASSRAINLDSETYTANALAFCSRIQEAGYTPMIYCNTWDMSQYMNASELETYDIWLAQYGVSQPQANFDFVMWQYTTEGSVAGIDTAVDFNVSILDRN
ncbi:MAG: glycoside hydrolase family 25 protein [Eggerthellaceae bacterium]|jgi:lysozyme